MRTLRPNFIVGIGGSAGGLDAYKALFDAMPSTTGMAFVIISHLMPAAHSQMAQILSRHTKMPVLVAGSKMPIWGNHVYVNSPDEDLSVENYAFKVVSPRTGRNKQVDVFFTSLAAAMGKRAIGIILSGFDGDGTQGCRLIKAKGGATFAQDNSAEVGHMPHSAQAAGCIDFILPPESMPHALRRLAGAIKKRVA